VRQLKLWVTRRLIRGGIKKRKVTKRKFLMIVPILQPESTPLPMVIKEQLKSSLKAWDFLLLKLQRGALSAAFRGSAKMVWGTSPHGRSREDRA